MYKVEFNNKADWLKARETCLTGTTLSKYIGIKSPFKEKTQEELEKSPSIIFGSNCETPILTIFKNLPEIAKNTLVYPTIKPTLWFSKKDTRIAGSFDGLAFEGSKEGFCECKTTSTDLYDLNNNIIPETTWLQILQYFSINPKFEFCYLIVCKYKLYGSPSLKIEWKRINRYEIEDKIQKVVLWQRYILNHNQNFSKYFSYPVFKSLIGKNIIVNYDFGNEVQQWNMKHFYFDPSGNNIMHTRINLNIEAFWRRCYFSDKTEATHG